MYRILQSILTTLIVIIIISSCSKKFMVVDSPSQQPPARIIKNQPRVALVLGGGAFHGMAHVGVIKVLEEEGIPIDLIVGASAGSMVGALYADNPNIDSLLPLVEETKAKDVFDFSLFRSKEGFVSGKRLQSYLLKHINNTNIEDTKIPFIAMTTDIENGKSVALKAGPIAPSVNASCAIPGIFEPVKMYGTTYVDGGIVDNVPCDIAKEYNSKIIIAVNIMAFDTITKLNNYTDVIQRAFLVATHNLTIQKLQIADIIITPDLKGLPLMSSKDNNKMYKLGMEAARDALPELKKLIKSKGITLDK